MTATGGAQYGGAGIGCGIGLEGNNSGRCGDITISGKNTVVTATAGNPEEESEGLGLADDIGKDGYQGQCGTVTIKGGATVNGTVYTEETIGPVN